jgi:hypothetical protein
MELRRSELSAKAEADDEHTLRVLRWTNGRTHLLTTAVHLLSFRRNSDIEGRIVPLPSRATLLHVTTISHYLLPAETDLDRFDDAVEWELRGFAPVSDEILRLAAEQEERHPVRRHQDAAERLRAVFLGTRDRRTADAAQELFDDLLGDPGPEALDDEGTRGASFGE